MSATHYRFKAAPSGSKVTAVQYEGANRQQMSDFLGDRYGFFAPYVLIRGDEDDLRVKIGEWVIRDQWGQFFSSAHENFTAWYEPDFLREALEEIAAFADDYPGSEPMQRVYELAVGALTADDAQASSPKSDSPGGVSGVNET